MSDYTPEKVDELIGVARRYNAVNIVRHLADALTAVSAELEHLKRFDWLKQNKRTEGERDRLHKAITEALEILTRGDNADPAGEAWRILRAALEQKGNET